MKISCAPLAKLLWKQIKKTHCILTNKEFANHSKEDKVYPLTTAEIVEAQLADATQKLLLKCNAVIDKGLEIKLIENTTCVCKDGWLAIPKPLQVWAVKHGITIT